MTKEEAIESLKSIIDTYEMLEEKQVNSDIPLDGEDIQALDMAISALSEELAEDGTLVVHVSDGSKVKRVFVMGYNMFGGLYYPDSENKGER